MKFVFWFSQNPKVCTTAEGRINSRTRKSANIFSYLFGSLALNNVMVALDYVSQHKKNSQSPNWKNIFVLWLSLQTRELFSVLMISWCCLKHFKELSQSDADGNSSEIEEKTKIFNPFHKQLCCVHSERTNTFVIATLIQFLEPLLVHFTLLSAKISCSRSGRRCFLRIKNIFMCSNISSEAKTFSWVERGWKFLPSAITIYKSSFIITQIVLVCHFMCARIIIIIVDYFKAFNRRDELFMFFLYLCCCLSLFLLFNKHKHKAEVRT
jgi:hypothetical protein